MVDAKEMFACGHCQTLHGTYEEATQCCEPNTVWACGKCEMSWDDDKEGAENCCKKDV